MTILWDERDAPLIRVTFTGSNGPDDDLREFLARMGARLTQGKVSYYLFDATEAKQLGAGQAKAQAEWMIAHRREIEAVAPKVAIVLNSPGVRFLLAGIFLIQPMTTPFVVVETVEEGLTWLTEQMRRDGLRTQIPPRFGGRRLRVLLVDDNPIAREVVTEALASAGHECVAVGSPFEFIHELRSRRPHVALVDVRLPALSGDRLVEFAREGARTSAACKFWLYSDLDPGELERLTAIAGADGYLQKSRGLEHLLGRLAAVSPGSLRPEGVA